MTSTPYDSHLSVFLALGIGAEPYRCWRNAVLALFSCANGLEAPCYVEGWIVLPRQRTIDIMEHGWITSGSRIVDPSIVLVESPEQAISYFAGFELASNELPQRLQGKTLPLVCHGDYGPDGLLHPGYCTAQQQAWQRARELAQQKYLLESAIVVSQRVPTGATTLIFS